MLKNLILFILCFGVSLLVSAAEEKKKVFKPYLEVVDTKYTKNCKPFSLRLEEEKRSVKGFADQKFYKRFLSAIDSLSNDDLAEAQVKFQSLYDRSRPDSYDRAATAQNYAMMYLQQEKYDEALKLLIEAVESKSLPVAQDLDMMINISYIYSLQEKWSSVVDWTKRYFANSTKADDSVYIMLGQAYINLNQFDKSICAAKHSVELDEKRPEKARFTMILSGHYNLKDMEGTLAVGKQMVEVYPEVAQYWKQLPSLYSQVGKNIEALAVQDIAYIGGYLDKPSDFKNLSAMWAQAGGTFQSARIREETITKGQVESNESNWKFAAGMYRSSRELEKAANAFSEAAKFSDTGEHFLSKGEMLKQKELWKEAIEAYTQALQRGGIDGRKTGTAYINRALAKYRLKRYNSALEDLDLAMRYKSTKKDAVQWSNFVKNRMKYAGFNS